MPDESSSDEDDSDVEMGDGQAEMNKNQEKKKDARSRKMGRVQECKYKRSAHCARIRTLWHLLHCQKSGSRTYVRFWYAHCKKTWTLWVHCQKGGSDIAYVHSWYAHCKKDVDTVTTLPKKGDEEQYTVSKKRKEKEVQKRGGEKRKQSVKLTTELSKGTINEEEGRQF